MNNKIEEFKNIAKKRWVYLENGDSKNGNKCFNELEKIIKEYKQNDNLEKLLVLLEDSNDSVKFEIASKLVKFYPGKSIPVLESLANKRGILPFAAKQTLKQWKFKN